MSELLDAWSSLPESAPSKDGWLAKRIAPSAPVAILAALEYPSRNLALLVEVGAAAFVGNEKYLSVRGLQFFSEVVQPGRKGVVRLCLVMQDGGDERVFRAVALDVVQGLLHTGDSKAAIAALFSRIAVWQRFFNLHAGPMSFEEELGLLGELSVLDLLLAAGCDPFSAIAAWQGPTDSPKDYCFPGCEIEVKAGLGLGNVSIHGAEQLEIRDERPLFLSYVRCAEAHDTTGITLNAYANRLREMLVSAPEAARSGFEDRLLRAGLSELRVAQPQPREWHVLQHYFFSVQDNFPRIIGAQIMSGITKVNYQLMLRDCMPYQVSAEEVVGRIVKGPTSD